MERAERLVLLGVGLAFDILVPVLWVMLVLTAFTAVQRFVKVWRQATPERPPPRTRHHRGSGTEEPRAGSLAQWWAAHRPQTERAGRSRSARPVAADRTTPRVARPPETHAVLRVPRRCRDRPRACPSRVGAPARARGRRPVGPAVMTERRARWSATCAASTGPGSAAPRCGATVDRDLRLLRSLLLRAVPPARHEPEWIEAHFRVRRPGAHRGRRGRRASGAVLALPAPRELGLRRRLARGLQGYTVTVVAEPVEPPELFDWFVETRARLGMRVIPLVAVGGHRGARRRCAPTRWCASSPTATSPATASRSSSSASAPRCPAGPALLALRGGAPLLPAGCYFRDRRPPRDAHPPADRRRRARGRIRDDLARVTQDLAHRFEDLIREAPEHWHLLQPNWPSDRGSDPAAARSGVG